MLGGDRSSFILDLLSELWGTVSALADRSEDPVGLVPGGVLSYVWRGCFLCA